MNITKIPIINTIFDRAKSDRYVSGESYNAEIKPIIVPTLTTPRSLNTQSDILIQNAKTREEFSKFLSKKGKVTFEEYDDIIKNHPAVYIEARKYVEDLYNHRAFKTTPDISAIYSLLAKERFDSLYGKDNYKIVSIGTSPSFITESMKELGADVIYLPISNAAHIDCNITEYLTNHPNLEHCLNYLIKNGINNEDLKGKSVILLDYFNTGRTINLVRDLIGVYGDIEDSGISLEDMTNLLYSIRKYSKSYRKYTKLKEDFDYNSEFATVTDMENQRAEFMSNTPHYSVYKESFNKENNFSVETGDKAEQELFEEFDNFSKPSARAYQLCVLHEISKIKGKIK